MSKLLRYNDRSEHFTLPYNDRKLTVLNGKSIEYIGTVVLRRNGSNENTAKFDVYYIERFARAGIKPPKDDPRYFGEAQVMERIERHEEIRDPIFDCFAIKEFAKRGYYFVDERTGQKSLRCFNIRWHVPEILSEYVGCRYFSSIEHHRDDAEWEDGIVVR